jgi:hypothetical protein
MWQNIREFWSVATTMTNINTVLPSHQALWLRLAVGGFFGLLIPFLAHFESDKDYVQWRVILAGILTLIVFVIWAGAGAMRRVSLVIWTAIVGVFLFYMQWTALSDETASASGLIGQNLLIVPLLFIAHELVSSGDQGGKQIAPYATYFDEGWKRGVQLALAILFTLLFWGILWLGAALLGFIGFEWLSKLLENFYFVWPATGLAFGAAVHLGDVQTKLLSSVRSLILGVLSWLLPVIAVIGAIFAASLLKSGLAPLWATKAATVTLLGACVGFVLLINAAYQQGDVERSVPKFLKWCVRIAAVLLFVFAVLAAWSLSLRINQYGLTPDRVFAGLGVIIALAYGIGYSVAVFVPGRWMAAVEGLNIYFAIFICALFVAVLTPIASPERLSVADQVARLNGGKVSVADFDWWLLSEDTGTYGKRALTALSASTNAAIATKAKAALDDKIGYRPYREYDQETDQKPDPIAQISDIERIQIVFPKDAKLPESFIKAKFSGEGVGFAAPGCLRIAPKAGAALTCKAALLDLNDDGAPEVLIREGPSLTIFTQIKGVWTGNQGYLDVGSSEADFDAGKLLAAPTPWKDLMIGQRRQKAPSFQDPDIRVTLPASQPAPPPSK